MHFFEMASSAKVGSFTAVQDSDPESPVFIGVGTLFSHMPPAMHRAFDNAC
jgi:hypothetical protein